MLAVSCVSTTEAWNSLNFQIVQMQYHFLLKLRSLEFLYGLQYILWLCDDRGQIT